ncbi:hypothetical protein AR505_0987 [methanogenic archaeon ISO4-H5]|nr:hypothetical protein AR505_0987 [methanogenic archaeon ISO4-H5]
MIHDHIRKILADKRIAPLVDVTVKIAVPSGFVPGYLQPEIRHETLRGLESLYPVDCGIDCRCGLGWLFP